jgi:SAM-dependent methyltransferase
MRFTYRTHGGSKAYWHKRWDQIPADDGVLNLDRYPGRYAEAVMQAVDGPILEAGCGAGRVLLHYRRAGRPIVGMDFIEVALRKIRAASSEVPLSVADVTRLPFADESFAGVLAFGLYHSLEHGIEDAFAETRRIMRPGGLLCASMRADNLQNRVVDRIADRDAPADAERRFHKANYSRREFADMLAAAGFTLENMEYVENMPFLYKFPYFRHRDHQRFDEHRARGEGYKLSPLGQALQSTLIGLAPASFCNINVGTARAV